MREEELELREGRRGRDERVGLGGRPLELGHVLDDVVCLRSVSVLQRGQRKKGRTADWVCAPGLPD